MALDYLESDLPQSWFWRAATWPLTLALGAWLLSLRHGSSVQCEGATPPSGPAVYVTWHRYSPLLVALLARTRPPGTVMPDEALWPAMPVSFTMMVSSGRPAWP